MIIVCQQCGQKLPKTAVMCPNCGSRQFAQQSDNHTQPPNADNAYDANQTSQVNQPENSTWQSYTPNPPAQPPDYATPYVAPAVQPQQPSQYPTPATNQLPSTALQTRKPAYTMLYAGFVRRALAYLFDLALVSLLLGLAYQLLLPQILPQLGIRGFTDQTLALIAYGFYLFYMTLLTCLGRQATVGKVIMGMWVFGMQGQRLNFFHALIRETLKLMLLPFGFLMWFTARKQTLHDLIARTVVLYDPN